MAVALEDHVSELLQRDPNRSLTVQQLHTLLIHEVGPSAGTYHDLQARLKRAASRFLLVDRATPFAAEGGWSHEVREAYSGALDRAGVDFSPIVSLGPVPSGPEHPADVVAALRTTLLALSLELEDPRAREDILSTLLAVSSCAGPVPAMPTTTPPPGPLPAG